MKWKYAIAAAAMSMMFAPSMVQADSSLSGVEGARAKERQGAYLNRQDRDSLRRYGSNDDYGYGYGYAPYGYGGGYYADDYYGYGPAGVSIYIGPGY